VLVYPAQDRLTSDQMTTLASGVDGAARWINIASDTRQRTAEKRRIQDSSCPTG
jgi:hypothetical protein